MDPSIASAAHARAPDGSRGPWGLDPAVAFLNHGSYGACPTPVLAAQQAWRDLIEAQPVRFMDVLLPEAYAATRTALGSFLGADPAGLVFVTNATSGVATVLGSLRFEPGDELLTTDHEYNAILAILQRAADREGATVVRAPIPFPIEDPEEATDAILGAVTARTRLAVFSHITSPTALILPAERIVRALAERGVDALVDGAHVPGMVALEIDRLGAAYYTGNAHKWLCAPKGAGFLWVREDRRERIRPLVTSHGANDPRTDVPRYRLEFDWTGTGDPSPWLCIPAAIETMGSLRAGGWPEVMATNHALALEARELLATRLGLANAAPDAMLGSMAALALPATMASTTEDAHELNASLRKAGIEVPITPWPVRGARDPGEGPRLVLVRVSAQLYNRIEDYERLADALEPRILN